jgi:hypothetical protein
MSGREREVSSFSSGEEEEISEDIFTFCLSKN